MESPKPDLAQEVEWVERSQRGDHAAFGLLAEKYRRRIFSLVFHIIRRADPVEDLAQEILIKAFVAIRSFNFKSPFGAWLSRIAVHHCYDYLRRQRVSRLSYYSALSEEREREIEERLARPQAGIPNAEQQLALRDFVAKLLDRAPADDRVILTLRELEGLSMDEIAQILNLRTSTVKVRLHRARKRMLQDLKRWRQGR